MATMTIHTRRCGVVRYDDNSVVEFPEGLAGFERLRKFIIVPDAETKLFHWLLSIEDESVGFLLVDPARISSQYVSELPAQSPGAMVYCIVTVREELEKTTVNFKAPVVVDTLAGVGRQLIMNSERFPVEHTLLLRG